MKYIEILHLLDSLICTSILVKKLFLEDVFLVLLAPEEHTSIPSILKIWISLSRVLFHPFTCKPALKSYLPAARGSICS